MKSWVEFIGISRKDKERLAKEYLKEECSYIVISYFFILLSSAQPFFSWKNGALYVLVWFTISIVLSIFAYISQNDYLCRRKKAVNYSRHKRTKVITGTYVKPEIGGWSMMGMFYVGASLVSVILLIIAEYLQFKDLNLYMGQYKNLFIGIFVDTYIVTFFGIILQLFIDEICNCLEDKSELKKKIKAINPKILLISAAAIVIAVFALSYYFLYEFEGLFINSFVRRIVGLIYILFLLFPGIDQLYLCITKRGK